jgi:2-keto-4-pentenoate hydratase/2-oxohepta-3-ene-1,7-dioic acid hydratase in catechol pathway
MAGVMAGIADSYFRRFGSAPSIGLTDEVRHEAAIVVSWIFINSRHGAFMPLFPAPGHFGDFALGAFAAEGRPFAGLVVGERVLDLTALDGLGRLTVDDLLADWDSAFVRLRSLAASASGPWIPLAELRALPPVRPRQVLQSGANYRKHVVDIVLSERRADPSDTRTEDEARAWAEKMMDDRAAHGTPYVFIGLPSAICGPCDDIVLPSRGTKHDWELELAAVIGRRGRNVPRSEALEFVAGYTICNDLTTRSLVYRPDLTAIGTDWFAAKNAPTFLPTGPYLVPAAFVPDPMDLRITLRHNGTVRQDESTADMIFDLPALISYVSSVVELHPGDLLLTGSPAGNGAHWGVYLEPGDVVEAEITGLGGQRNLCVEEGTER